MIFKKAIQFYLKNSFFDLIRKIIYFFINIFSFRFLSIIRSCFFFKSFGVRIGKNVTLSGFGVNLKIGKDVNIYDSCIVELCESSNLIIGNRVIFSYGVVLSCRNKISIGDNVQIGEYTSIRDSTHNYKGENSVIMNNNDIIGEIKIGNNVWIGRNCLISLGSKIGNNVVIGSNSIVKGILEDNGVYAGNPIRKI